MNTTLRVKIPIFQKAKLETLAKQQGLTYRAYLVQLLEQAINSGFEPEFVLDTRVVVCGDLKADIISRASNYKYTPDAFALSVFANAATQVKGIS